MKSPADCKRLWTNKKDALTIICYGIFGLMLCQYSYFKAIEYSNAGTATILALLGVFLLATQGQPGHIVISGQALFWGLFSAGTVVLYNLIPRGLMRTYSTPFLLGFAMLIGGIALCILRKPWLYHPIMDFGTLLSFLWLKTDFAALDIAGFFCIVSTLFLITFWGKKETRL